MKNRFKGIFLKQSLKHPNLRSKVILSGSNRACEADAKFIHLAIYLFYVFFFSIGSGVTFVGLSFCHQVPKKYIPLLSLGMYRMCDESEAQGYLTHVWV